MIEKEELFRILASLSDTNHEKEEEMYCCISYSEESVINGKFGWIKIKITAKRNTIKKEVTKYLENDTISGKRIELVHQMNFKKDEDLERVYISTGFKHLKKFVIEKITREDNGEKVKQYILYRDALYKDHMEAVNISEDAYFRTKKHLENLVNPSINYQYGDILEYVKKSESPEVQGIYNKPKRLFKKKHLNTNERDNVTIVKIEPDNQN